jgi:hypothetical protein
MAKMDLSPSSISPPLGPTGRHAHEHASAANRGVTVDSPGPMLHLETPLASVLYILGQANRVRRSKRNPSKTEIILLRSPEMDPHAEFSRALRKCRGFKKLRGAGIDWRILHNVCLLFRGMAVLEAREKVEKKPALRDLRRALRHSERVKKLIEPYLWRRLPFKVGIEIEYVCEELERRIAGLKRSRGKPQQHLPHLFSATCGTLVRGWRRKYYAEFSELAEFVFLQNRPGRYSDVRTDSFKRELKYVERWIRDQSRMLMIHDDGSTEVVGHI